MAIIKVKSVKDIPKLKKFKVESTNKLYFQENDYIVKIFLDCYRSLDQKIGKDIFNLLVKLFNTFSLIKLVSIITLILTTQFLRKFLYLS